MRLITVPVQKKLVDDEAAQKLLQRLADLKKNFQPQQGWVDAASNAIGRLPIKQ